MASKWALARARFLRSNGILRKDDDAREDWLARALDAAYRAGERRGRERAAEWLGHTVVADFADIICALPDEDPPEDDRD